VPATLEQCEGVCLLRLDGECNIASAAELKSLMAQALGCSRELRIDLEHATGLDITTLQLLWVCGRDAQASGVSIALVGRVPDDVLLAARHAGFDRFPVG
jgi:anti-anti-sigma regulatory factor